MQKAPLKSARPPNAIGRHGQASGLQPVFEGEVGHDLFQRLRLPAEILHLVRGRGARRVARQPRLPASRNSFDQP